MLALASVVLSIHRKRGCIEAVIENGHSWFLKDCGFSGIDAEIKEGGGGQLEHWFCYNG